MSSKPRNRVLILDDCPTQRQALKTQLRKLSGVVMPDSTDDVKDIDIGRVGLVIIDRIMPKPWEQQARGILERLPDGVPIWEWTCDSGDMMEPLSDRVTRSIPKTIDALVGALCEWVVAQKTATV